METNNHVGPARRRLWKCENYGENDNSQTKIEEFIKDQQTDNTVRKTKTDMNTLQRYLKSVSREEIQIEQLPPEADHLLSKFLIDVRKLNGEEYEVPKYLNGCPQKCTKIFKREKLSSQYSGGPSLWTITKNFGCQTKKSLLKAGKGNIKLTSNTGP